MAQPIATELQENGTAADVAELAGVSIYTVSRAFSGSKVVSEQTRERIFSAAQKVGYVPHAGARALRTGKVPTIALVQPERVMSGEFYCDILAGLQDATQERNFDVLISSVPAGIALESWIAGLVSAGRCGAVALLMTVRDEQTLAKLRQIAAPIVLLNCAADECVEQQISSVGFDNCLGVQQAVRHLHAIGHEHIAFFGCPSLWGDTQRRDEGFRSGMAEMRLSVREEWVADCVAGAPSAADAFDQLFSAPGEKPTAIICATDDLMLGLLCAAARWGKTVPRDISVIGFGDSPWTAYHSPSITTVRHKGWDLGEKAGELLLRLYDASTAGAEHIVLPTQLIVRQSTAPPAPAT